MSILASCGCLFSNSETYDITHYFFINDAKGEYVYFPMVVDDNSTVIFTKEDYHIQNGKGNIDYVEIDGHRMLNITINSDEISFLAKNKDVPDGPTYCYWNSSEAVYFKGELRYTKLYYSGDNEILISSRIGIGYNGNHRNNKIEI